MATAVLGLMAIALIWQSVGFSNTIALASPAKSAIVAASGGYYQTRGSVRGEVDKNMEQTKDFVRNTADKVEQTAFKNAKRVEQATGEKGGFFSRRARNDAARIQKRAEGDAARTQRAIDNTKNAIKDAVTQ